MRYIRATARTLDKILSAFFWTVIFLAIFFPRALDWWIR